MEASRLSIHCLACRGLNFADHAALELSGAESSGTIEKDGKVYLDPVQTTATALRRCQEEHLPDEEHSKKYVRKGSVSMCKTAVLLHQMYNAVAAAGGLKELKVRNHSDCLSD